MQSNAQASPPVRRVHRNHDYIGLFGERIFPTGEIDILERGNHLLVIKSYEYGQKMADPHRYIFKLLVKLGDQEDAPGSVTVVCVWGLGPAPREFVVFDSTGETEPKLAQIDEWQSWLRAWWRDHK